MFQKKQITISTHLDVPFVAWFFSTAVLICLSVKPMLRTFCRNAALRGRSARGSVITNVGYFRENVLTYKPHTNHKRSSVRSHNLAPTSICGLSQSLCWSPLTDLGHISSVTYVCHPLWFVCGHRKGILMSPLTTHWK